MDKISFRTAVDETQDDDGKMLPLAIVSLLVNDIEPLKSTGGAPFDAMHILVQRDVPGEFDPYTCSCGVAGCAGFHWSWKQSVVDNEVRWTAPNEAPLSGQAYRFDQQEFLHALELLEEELTALQGQHPALAVAPFSGHRPDGKATRTISESLDEWRASFLRQRARERATALGLGDLYEAQVSVDYAGRTYEISVSSLISEFYEDDVSYPNLKQLAAAARRTRDALAIDATAVLRQMEWDDAHQMFWHVRKPNEDYAPLTEACPEDFWDTASIKIVKETL